MTLNETKWGTMLWDRIAEANGRKEYGWGLKTITGTIRAALSVVLEAFEAGRKEGRAEAFDEADQYLKRLQVELDNATEAYEYRQAIDELIESLTKKERP